MENLLCDESWLSGPTRSPDHYHCRENRKKSSENDAFACYKMTSEEVDQALFIDLQKEPTYMPEPSYIEFLRSKDMVDARFQGVQWMIRSCRRMNLSVGTIFSAANYLDRFISKSHCEKWKYWMVELLSIACVSIASKFNDTSRFTLHEIQMEGLDHSFHPLTIQQMELLLLKTVEWKLGAITSYSFFELIISRLQFPICNLHEELITRATDLLLEALIDCEMLEYSPSVVAASALWVTLDEYVPSTIDKHLESITKFFNEDRKDNLDKCHASMKSQCPTYMKPTTPGSSSPVTVLLRNGRDVKDLYIDLSLFQTGGIASGGSNKKREQEDEE